MIIQIAGTSTRNKGAELMLASIRQHFEQRSPDIQLAVDFSFGSYSQRARYGLLTNVKIRKIGRSRLAMASMPSSLRQALGLVDEAGITAVLDASGFAFGDQHPLGRSTSFALQAERWASHGKPLVLMPQALGPFDQPDHAKEIKRIVDASTLVFARDAASYDSVKRVVGKSDKLRIAPDFTNLVKPNLVGLSAESQRVCIVPNIRMLEKARNDLDKAKYISLFANCAKLATKLGFEPVVLLHGAEDKSVAKLISAELGRVLPFHELSDPLGIKKFIGESYLLIGSRFHALASALSQGVPVFASSWSHKYEALLEDYGQSDCLLNVDTEEHQLLSKMESLLGAARNGAVSVIHKNAQLLEQKTKEMWQEVDQALGLKF